MKAITIITEARRWGLRLEPRGDKLAVIPGSKCPPELAELLREHKAEVLSYLEAWADRLPEDQAPWLHVARQVLAGEFNGADWSTRESLTIGLRSIRHSVCRQALERLTGRKEAKP